MVISELIIVQVWDSSKVDLEGYSRIKLIPDHQHSRPLPRPLPRIPTLVGSQLYASSLTGDLEYPPIGFLEPSVLRDGRSRGKEVGQDSEGVQGFHCLLTGAVM